MIKTFFGTRILHITELIGLLFCYFKQILKVCTYVLLFKYRSSLFFPGLVCRSRALLSVNLFRLIPSG